MWLALVLACGPDTTAPGGTHALVVEGGSGSGEYAAGDRIQVWAGVDPQVALASWSGDMLPDPPEWNGTITMPDHDALAVAQSVAVDAPLVERTYPTEAGDRTVLASVVAEPVGVVLFFHGAAYSVDQLRSNAGRTLTMALVRAGYTVVALPSTAEVAAGTGGWSADLADDNSDLVTTRALVDAMRSDGTIRSGSPVFAWGMSSGAQFASVVGAALPTDGVVSFCAPGTADAIAETSAPTAWYLASMDRTFPTAVADATGFASQLGARGIASEVYVHPPTPLYDARFERITEIDADLSRELADALRASGAVDAAGIVAVGAEIDVDAELREAVVAEIEIMAADHELYDDVAVRMVGFLDGLGR